jgi:hypothetical protein
MPQQNSFDGEIVEYLRFLVDHESEECTLQNCPLCGTLENVCDLVGGLLFSNGSNPAAVGSTVDRDSITAMADGSSGLSSRTI